MVQLGNRITEKGGFFSTATFDIRNNCVKNSWALSQTEMLGDELDMIVLGYQAGMGWLKPIRSTDSLKKQLAERLNKRVDQITLPSTQEEMIDTILSFTANLGIVWFIPVFPAGSKFEKLVEAGKVPANCIWRTIIKSRSLDGEKTAGFWKHLNNLAAHGQNLTDVITVPRFDVVGKSTNAGTDYSGLVWSHREPADDAERERLAEAQKFLQTLIDNDRIESTFQRPSILEQFIAIDNDGVRSLAPAFRRQLLLDTLEASFKTEDLAALPSVPQTANLLSTGAVDVETGEITVDAQVTTVDAVIDTPAPAAPAAKAASRRI